jgi:hypothetical protein
LTQLCWRESPDDRPTFTEIGQQLIKLLEVENVQYNYVDAVGNNEIEFSDSETSEVNV